MEQPPELLVKRYSKRDDFLNRDTFCHDRCFWGGISSLLVLGGLGRQSVRWEGAARASLSKTGMVHGSGNPVLQKTVGALSSFYPGR